MKHLEFFWIFPDGEWSLREYKTDMSSETIKSAGFSRSHEEPIDIYEYGIDVDLNEREGFYDAWGGYT